MLNIGLVDRVKEEGEQRTFNAFGVFVRLGVAMKGNLITD
jgi:hypothetical protein